MTPGETPLDTVRAYSSADIAEILGVTRQTVHRWIADGRLAAFNIGIPGGRPRLRVAGDDLRAFIEASRINGGSVA